MIEIGDLSLPRRACYPLVGAVLGTLTALCGLVVLARGDVLGLRRHARQERNRLVRWFHTAAVAELPDRDPAGYVLLRALHAVAGGVVLIVAGAAALAYFGWALELTLVQRIPLMTSAVSLAVGAVAIYLCRQFALALGHGDAATAMRYLGDDGTQRRLRELERTRAGVIGAVDDERRRIERTLHDGVQQRTVTLALQLGRIRRVLQRQNATALAGELDHAVDEATRLIADLREVAWRIYPSVLDERGLEAALRDLPAHTTMRLWLDLHIDREPPPAIAAAAYFVVAEAVTNATKHSGAKEISVSVTQLPDRVVTVVRDEGIGGADPEGGGLTGLRRRVAALDGVFEVHSPAGGPTTVTAELPCAS
ncbi:sensor histidine kinase [Nocardia tengchongensis]|uniref:sensor histidine kinase n=1 Tax=Nocardia tengchongensis TaxID=2055889 RepID=UPI003677798C